VDEQDRDRLRLGILHGPAQLALIAVRQKFRRSGVASELIRRLMEENGPPLWLMCRSVLAGFYARFGFVVVEDPIRMPRYFQRVHRMVMIAGRLLPPEGKLAVMLWKGDKPAT
jgi:predicted N-acetyltransferase YhbS